MDDEKEEQPPFRWNPQAVFMLFFFMFAMAVPLAGVVWFARGYLSAQQRMQSPAPPAKAIDTSALEQGLERMSDERFSTTVTVETKDSVELRVIPAEMTARIARILEIAKEAGGSGLEMEAAGKGTRRVMIQVPASRDELLKRAIRGERVDFSAIPAGAETQLLEIDLKAP